MDTTRAAKLALGRKKLENHQLKKKSVETPGVQKHAVCASVDNNDGHESPLDTTKTVTANGASDSYCETSPITCTNVDSDRNIISFTDNPLITSDLSFDQEDKVLKKFSHDHNKLGEVIATYQKSIEILIHDKSELSNEIKILKSDLMRTKDQNVELISKVTELNNCITDIEQNLNVSKSENFKFTATVDSLVREKNVLVLDKRKIEEKCREFEEKIDENTNMLQTLAKENQTLQSDLQQAKSDYEISQLHIQQVSKVHDSTDMQQQLLVLVNEKNTFIKLLEETQKKLQESESDKNQVNQQYQQYVQQLNDQLESLTDKYQNLLLDFENTKDHERSLLFQMGNLETQLQSGNTQYLKIETTATDDYIKNLLAENETYKTEKQGLHDKLNVAEDKCNKLETSLSERELKIEELKEALQQMEKVDVHKLIVANESDRVAAQLATTQNLKLKDEIVAIQEAYNGVINIKLELSQLLETERNLNKDLMRKLGEDEYNVKELQIKLKAKDDEMIRLQSNCRNLETELLHLTQENDNLRHYEAISQNINLLQNELDSVHQKQALLVEENENLKQENILSEKHDEIHCIKNNTYFNKSEKSNIHSSDLPLLPNEEAMRKLQDRFAVTVRELAELSDEKQKLEHIVLQLQSETETICEYIALYHKQRAVLKQREIEKNAQLTLIVQEKSKLMKQLSELKFLIRDFLSMTKTISQNVSTNVENEDNITQKILSLLDDITNFQINEDNDLRTVNFAPCPCCSGNIIDV